MPSLASHTITFRKAGVKPPVYLAGSFSEPQWEPQEMDCASNSDGEYVYTSRILVVPERDYQFKFRIGDDWWILDERQPIGDIPQLLYPSSFEPSH